MPQSRITRALASQIVDAMKDTMKANGTKDGYIRLVALRGAGSLGIHPFRTVSPQVFIIVDKIGMYEPEMYEKGMKVITASTIRNHPAALSPQIKSLNYLNNIMAKIEGLQAGCIEALMLNAKGEVAECTGDNIFIVRKGVLQTPPIDAGILEGITRDAVLEHGADPNFRGPYQYTPLYLAAQAGHSGTIELLLRHGVDIDGRADDAVAVRGCSAGRTLRAERLPAQHRDGYHRDECQQVRHVAHLLLTRVIRGRTCGIVEL